MLPYNGCAETNIHPVLYFHYITSTNNKLWLLRSHFSLVKFPLFDLFPRWLTMGGTDASPLPLKHQTLLPDLIHGLVVEWPIIPSVWLKHLKKSWTPAEAQQCHKNLGLPNIKIGCETLTILCLNSKTTRIGFGPNIQIRNLPKK